MSPNKKLRVYISDQPDTALISKDLITRTQRNKFHRDLSDLVKERQARSEEHTSELQSH